MKKVKELDEQQAGLMGITWSDLTHKQRFLSMECIKDVAVKKGITGDFESECASDSLSTKTKLCEAIVSMNPVELANALSVSGMTYLVLLCDYGQQWVYLYSTHGQLVFDYGRLVVCDGCMEGVGNSWDEVRGRLQERLDMLMNAGVVVENGLMQSERCQD